MATTTWKNVVLDTADAYRSVTGTTATVEVGQLASKIENELCQINGYIYFSSSEPSSSDGVDGDIWIQMD